jgi:hypothetical protein
VRLYISTGTAENVGHFGSNSREVVYIDFELVL